MMTWEQDVNRELGDLNDAHSAARIDTPEYRRRRRALLNDTLRQEGVTSHTLRRPATAAAGRIGGAARAGGMARAGGVSRVGDGAAHGREVGGMAASRSRPGAAGAHATAIRSSGRRVFLWCFAIAVVVGGIATWLTLWPPI
jgi:hypothetical protein